MIFSKRYKNSVTPVFSECGKMVANANGSKVTKIELKSLNQRVKLAKNSSGSTPIVMPMTCLRFKYSK